MKSVVLAALFLFGCTQGSEIPDCVFAYRVDADLLAEAEEAASRWSTATGCSISVSPTSGDRVIKLVNDLVREDGTASRGATSEGGKLIRIHEKAAQKLRTMLHEMGHSLGSVTGHNAGHGVLSNDSDYVPVIDSLSLSDVCEKIQCLAFVIEGEP